MTSHGSLGWKTGSGLGSEERTPGKEEDRVSIQVCGRISSEEMGESHSLQYLASLKQSYLFSSKRELAITGIFAGRQNNPSKQTMTGHTGLCSLEINVKDGAVQN